MRQSKDRHVHLLSFLVMISIVAISWGKPYSMMGLPHNVRNVRSCTHHQILALILGSCNNNYKRSPVLVNLIFVHYHNESHHGHPDSGGVASPAQDTAMGSGPTHHDLLDPLTSPWVLEHVDIQEAQFDPKKFEFLLDDQPQPHQHQHPVSTNAINNRDRSGRASSYHSMLHPILEKCCSAAGCSEADFAHQCY